MLILARKKGQSIIIGKNIKVYVAEVTGETVRLGIDAPVDIEVFREEIYRGIVEENASSLARKKEMQELLLKNILPKKQKN